MQAQIHPLQQQLNRLVLISDFIPLEQNFISGYILKELLNVSPSNVKELLKVIELLLDVHQCQVIPWNTVLEFVVVLSHVCGNLEKHRIKSLMEFYEQCIGQVFNDNDYLRKRFFRNEPGKIVKNSQPISNFDAKKYIQESKSMGMNRHKSNLAECPICATQITHDDISALICGHIIHKNCFQGCMKQLILNKKFPLKCPFEQCKRNIQTADIEEYLPKELVDKYYEFTLHNFVDKNSKNMSWCPTAGCANAFEFDNGITTFECTQCKKSYCLNCKTQSHYGTTCQENKESMNLSQEDKKFIDFAKGAKYKQCPKCKFWVQKNHGCCHMTCRCTYEFCYRCGSKYGECNCQNEYDRYYGSSDGESELSNQQMSIQSDQHQNSRIEMQIRPLELRFQAQSQVKIEKQEKLAVEMSNLANQFEFFSRKAKSEDDKRE